MLVLVRSSICSERVLKIHKMQNGFYFSNTIDLRVYQRPYTEAGIRMYCVERALANLLSCRSCDRVSLAGHLPTGQRAGLRLQVHGSVLNRILIKFFFGFRLFSDASEDRIRNCWQRRFKKIPPDSAFFTIESGSKINEIKIVSF